MFRSLMCAVAASIAVSGSVAHAAPIAPDPASGYGFDVNYCEQNGLWNAKDTATAGAGLDWFAVPITSPGDPWQQVSIDTTSGTFTANGNECSVGRVTLPWDTLTLDAYGSTTPISFTPFGGYVGTNGSTTTWRAGNFQVYKHEYWGAADATTYVDGAKRAKDGQALIIDITVTALGCERESFVLMHAVDPDPDAASAGDHTTCNDTTYTGNLVISEGAKTGVVTAYGRCDDVAQEVGHTIWDTSASAVLSDEGWVRNDYTQHIRHTGALNPQESATFKFIFVTAADKTDAVNAYYAARDEVCCAEDARARLIDLDYVGKLGACSDLRVEDSRFVPND